jgi:cysteine-rich repeat protein
LTSLFLPALLVAAPVAARASVLEFLEVHVDGAGGADGLHGAEGIAISPDDAFVYTAAAGENAVGIYRRNAVSGALTYVGKVTDGAGGVDGLGDVRGLAISQDGAHLYAAAHGDESVAVFRRDQTTGLLTFVEVHKDGSGGITSLGGAYGVTLSPNAAYLYVASKIDSSVTVFRRSTTSGRLVLVQAHRDGSGGITTLGGAETVAVSPDGTHVYVAAPDDDAITVFGCDADTGALTLIETKKNGTAGIDSLDRVQGLALSPDGASLYAAASDDNAVTVFDRDPETGVLTLGAAYRDGSGGVDGIAGAEWVTVSANGAWVYAVGDLDDALAVFARDPSTGRLTFVEQHRNGVGGVSGLDGAEAVLADSGTRAVYVVSDEADAVSVFASLCGNGQIDSGETCDDGNTTNGDCCTAACGTVAAGAPCAADGNACTNDICNGAGACVHVDNSDPCDDGSFCTVGDRCGAGTCQGTPRDCSAAGDQCNAGVCDENLDACLPQPRPDDTSCDDGNACTQEDVCQAGACVGTDPIVCTAQDECHTAGVCDPATGACSNPVKPDGAFCDDGDACTRSDRCVAGTCVGIDPIVCTAQDQCHMAGACDPATGTCSNPVKPDGAFCDDGNACTREDVCQAGACVGTDPIVCTAQDQCHTAGVCNPATGTCSHPVKPAGTACDDGNACTRVDACQAGMCVGTDPVACTAQDQCHMGGTCDPATGACSQPAKPDGAFCDDGDACTRSDRCMAGACVGTDPIVCTAQDQCHEAGACDPATGACSNPIKANGALCDDGDACTRTDRCQAGACVGTDPVVCTAQDQCHTAGVCDPATGVCSHPAKPAGAACDDGNACTRVDACQGGACVGTDLVACTAQDQCHEAGVCDPATGACSNPIKANGALCDDGDACTRTDRCQAGACAGTNPIVCTAQDQCHTAGVCDPATGVCSNPAQPAGTACNDGDTCTRVDACQAGICVGTDPVVCTARDQCHLPGTCNPRTGECSDPRAPAGTACDDGNACTRVDACQAGVCVGTDAVECPTPGQCYRPGVCDPGTAQCSAPTRDDGARCDDGNACTRRDTCESGTCVGGDPVICSPLDQCHDAGVCDPATGACSNPATADGTVCDDADACTSEDTCVAGACLGDPVADGDGDGFCDTIDVCPQLWNRDQWDMNHDDIGDVCQCTATPPGRCIAGGGSKRTDCLLEISSAGFPSMNGRRTRVKDVLRCTDGDPVCDADGARDGKCTFAIAMCFGNADPRFLRCRPKAVASMELLSPLASQSLSAVDAVNARSLEHMMAHMGLEVRREGRMVSPSVAPVGDSICSGGLELVVPAPEKIGGRPVRRKFRLRATSVTGRRDTDRFALACHS